MKKSITPIILIIISFIFIGLGKIDKFEKCRTKITNIFSPIQANVILFFSISKIIKENELMKTKMAQLSIENQLLKKYKYENDELRKQLNFEQENEYTLIAAKIIARDPEPFSSICIINKGEKDEIKKGMPVITIDGLYGKVIDVTNKTAIVQTIFDYNFRVGCMNLRNGVQGIVRWENDKGLIFEHIPVGSDIKIEDEIVSLGIGETFIKGLKVGKVVKIGTDVRKLTYWALLQPACKIDKVENVFVIKEKSESFVSKPIKETKLWEINIEPKVKFEPKEPDIRK